MRFALDDVQGETSEGAATPATSVALGIGAALFNGVWGGSNLVPSKYAPLHGIHFTISFATGALTANVTIVLIYVAARCF